VKILLNFLVALLLPFAALAQSPTVTIPSRVITIPAQVITIPAQTLSITTATTPPPIVTPPVVVPPPPVVTGTTWVYHNGVFSWAGAYNFVANVSYTDTAGAPRAGPYDVLVTPTSRWGAWQPYAFGATGSPFDTAGYKYLIYSVKPTVAGQIIATGFDANNDVADGKIVVVAGPAITKYGPVPQPGIWASYKVPLADFGFSNPLVLKFTVADGCCNAPYYVDDVGFTP
jgi:hypothetical protein